MTSIIRPFVYYQVNDLRSVNRAFRQQQAQLEDRKPRLLGKTKRESTHKARSNDRIRAGILLREMLANRRPPASISFQESIRPILDGAFCGHETIIEEDLTSPERVSLGSKSAYSIRFIIGENIEELSYSPECVRGDIDFAMQQSFEREQFIVHDTSLRLLKTVVPEVPLTFDGAPRPSNFWKIDFNGSESQAGSNLGPAKSCDQIDTWQAQCSKFHNRCGSINPNELPRRLLEITETGIRLREGLEERACYVALSYRWGQDGTIRTLKENIERHKMAISYHELPPTLQNAVSTTTMLGYRFLWIDSLCIIQDDLADKQTEVAQMASIYRNAALVIATLAASADKPSYHASQSLANVQPLRSPFKHRRYARRCRANVEFVPKMSVRQRPFHASSQNLCQILPLLLDVAYKDLSWRVPGAKWPREMTSGVQRLLRDILHPSILRLCTGLGASFALELDEDSSTLPLMQIAAHVDLLACYIWHLQAIFLAAVEDGEDKLTNTLLLEAQDILRAIKCCDSRDKVYALLSLQAVTPMHADYSKTTTEVYASFAEELVGRDRANAINSMSWVHASVRDRVTKPQLPSWTWASDLRNLCTATELRSRFLRDIEDDDSYSSASLLHVAAADGQVELLKFLLAVGIDPNAEDKQNHKIALSYAAARGHLEAVDLLLDHGASPNFRESQTGLSPLHHAVMGRCLPSAALLIERGAVLEINGFESLSERNIEWLTRMSIFFKHMSPDITRSSFEVTQDTSSSNSRGNINTATANKSNKRSKDEQPGWSPSNRGNEGDDNDDDKNRNNKRRKKIKLVSTGGGQDGKELLCHFDAHPERSRNKRSCKRYPATQQGIHNLRQHLLDKHMLKKCPQCPANLAHNLLGERVDLHIQHMTQGCPGLAPGHSLSSIDWDVLIEGCGFTQILEFRKNSYKGMEPEKKWEKYWKILFPNKELPEQSRWFQDICASQGGLPAGPGSLQPDSLNASAIEANTAVDSGQLDPGLEQALPQDRYYRWELGLPTHTSPRNLSTVQTLDDALHTAQHLFNSTSPQFGLDEASLEQYRARFREVAGLFYDNSYLEDAFPNVTNEYEYSPTNSRNVCRNLSRQSSPLTETPYYPSMPSQTRDLGAAKEGDMGDLMDFGTTSSTVPVLRLGRTSTDAINELLSAPTYGPRQLDTDVDSSYPPSRVDSSEPIASAYETEPSTAPSQGIPGVSLKGWSLVDQDRGTKVNE